jgi:hypothetical protein
MDTFWNWERRPQCTITRLTPPGLLESPAEACDKPNSGTLSTPVDFVHGFCPWSGKLKIRRITLVSALARCDILSSEHSETAAFLGGGRQMDRVL